MKGLIHWQRSPKAELRNRLDRWFDSFFADPFAVDRWSGTLAPDGNGHGERVFMPSVEVKETETHVVVRAELPGVDAKDVDVELIDNVLVLTGKKEEQHEEKEGESTFSEFRFGSFRRELALPAEVDAGNVKATCEKGILTIEMPKSKVSKTRKIAVEAR